MRLQLTILLATLSLAACGEYTDDPSSDNWNTPSESDQTEQEEEALEASEPFAPAKSMRMRPDLELTEMKELTEDYDDIEVNDAKITAVSCVKELFKRDALIPESCDEEDARCAKEMSIENYKQAIDGCEPFDAIRSGYAIYDRDEKEVYLLDPSSFYRYEFELGFDGTIDINGEVIGTREGFPVLMPGEEGDDLDYTITPPPPADAAKSCM